MLKNKKTVDKEDIEGLFLLEDNRDFSIALWEILSIISIDYNPSNLNHVQKVLFLCMSLEDSGQADTILNFFDDYFSYSRDVVDALYEIGAPKSAELIKQVIELFPNKEYSFFKIMADKDLSASIFKINDEFSSYPDGLMDGLYRRYAETFLNDLI